MNGMKCFAAMLAAAVICLLCLPAQAETVKSAEEFVFVGNVHFGDPFDDVLESLYQNDVNCLDLREEYGDVEESALINAYGIGNIDRIRFVFVEVGGFPAYGYFYFDDENKLAFVRYVIDDIDNPEERDVPDDYRRIEEQLNAAYGATGCTEETGKRNSITPSLWPRDYTDEGVRVHNEVNQYSERLQETAENGVLIQHVLYTITQDDQPDLETVIHEVCYTYVPEKGSSWGF